MKTVKNNTFLTKPSFRYSFTTPSLARDIILREVFEKTMGTYILVNGQWKQATQTYILVSGQWKTASQVYILVGGQWKASS